MTMKIVMITPFAVNCYQWKNALTRRIEEELNVSVDFLEVFPSYLKRFGKNDDYWKKLKEADGVFVYTTVDTESLWAKNDDWWKLSYAIRKIMRKNAKMVVQFDDDLLWVFYPESRWWKELNKPVKDPKLFFEQNRLLEVADAYIKGAEITEFEKYTSKPVVQIFLPHLTYYQIDGRWNIPHPKNERIAVLEHSARGSSCDHTIENFIKQRNLPVTFFTIKSTIFSNKPMNQEECAKHSKELNLPSGSELYSLLPLNAYMDLLSQNFVAVDDCENYLGWSRFSMECAIANTPCIGSTKGVSVLFPDLYTKPQDYQRQYELIQRLKSDKKFYDYVVNKAYNTVKRLFSNETLYRKLIDLFTKIGTPESKIEEEKVEEEKEITTEKDEEWLNEKKAQETKPPEKSKHSAYNPDEVQAHPHP